MSPVLCQPPSKAGGASLWVGERHHGVGKDNRSTESDRTGRGEAHHVGPRGTPERQAARHNQGTRTGAKQQRPPGAANPGGAHNTQQTTAQNRCQATPNPDTTRPSQEWRGTSGARTQGHTHPDTPARSGGAQPKPEPKHTRPRRTPQPGVAGYEGSAHANAHTLQHPGQEWRGEAETGAQVHTPTPHTPARSGGVQAKRANE